jgi:hypothetical protein
MSILRTDQVQTTTGKPILNNTGSILQVVNTNTVGQTGEISTASATYVSTGLSVTITPLSASSKLFVQWSGNVKFNSGTGDDGMAIRMYRDGTAINVVSNDNLFYRGDAGTNNHHSHATISHYVNANSISPTTFTLYFLNAWGGTAFISKDWGSNQFTVWEIAA